MDNSKPEVRRQIRELLDRQKLAVLATEGKGQPYASLMAFAHTDDLHTILIATGKATHKYRNIASEPRVALLIDNRTESGTADYEPCALTVQGTVGPAPESDRLHCRSLFLARHPELASFLAADDTAFLEISVHHYLLVYKLHQVMELSMQHDRQEE